MLGTYQMLIGLDRGYFNNIYSYIMEVSFIGVGNSSTRKKTTDLPYVTTNHAYF